MHVGEADSLCHELIRAEWHQAKAVQPGIRGPGGLLETGSLVYDLDCRSGNSRAGRIRYRAQNLAINGRSLAMHKRCDPGGRRSNQNKHPQLSKHSDPSYCDMEYATAHLEGSAFARKSVTNHRS